MEPADWTEGNTNSSFVLFESSTTFIRFVSRNKTNKDEKRCNSREKRFSRLQLGNGTNVLVLNTAVVLASQDLEETIVTPILVPGVGNEPVGSTVLNTPAEKLDSVTAEVVTSDVLVDTRLVGHEILVDGEGDFHGTIDHKILLDILDSLGRVGLLELVLIILVGNGITLLALGDALGSGLGLAARLVLALAVVVALGEGVAVAPLLAAVLTTGRDTSALKVHPGVGEETTVATEAARGAAGQEILGGETLLVLALGGDAETVGSGLSSTEGPAGTAGGLVANLTNGGALGPRDVRDRGLGHTRQF